jgi:DNA polymerase II small subunit
MNEEAVKELTKQGCMVERDAAEILNQDDVEQIKNLETTPMYVSKNMVQKLRSKIEARPEKKQVMTTSGAKVEPEEKEADTEQVQEEKEEASDEDRDDDIYDKKSSNFSSSKTVKIKDSGSRDRKTTKVELIDEKEISKEKKDVPEFLGYYNDRYDKMKKMLMSHREMKSATTINRLERRNKGEEATTIGVVNDKYSTRNSKYIVEIEDKTGTFKLLVEEREGDRIIQDEVIGVQGSLGGDIIYTDSIVRPDMPIPQGTKSTEQKVQAAYISDLHIGSQDTLHKRMDRFADWLSTEDAKDIGYLVITGDLVEGVGVYPGQDEELEIKDIYKQYEAFEQWFEKIPDDIQVIAGPGNHDITRLAEPQPRIDDDVFQNISDYNNFHLVQNPQMVRLHAVESRGIKNLMYHGYSFDGHADQIQELREKAYDEPHHLMIDLLKRRHLAPMFGSNLIAPDGEDPMVIEEEPDVFVAGHFHSHANSSYKGTNVICSSTFQAQTDFQKRVGHEPDPGKVTVVDFKTRNTEVKQF